MRKELQKKCLTIALKILGSKAAHGVDFINILPTAFKHVQIPKVQKKTDNLAVFFALLGSVHVKSAHRMMMKLTTIGKLSLSKSVKRSVQPSYKFKNIFKNN